MHLPVLCSFLLEIHTQSDDSAIILLSTEMSALSLSLPTAHVLTEPTNSNSVSVATEPDATLSVKVSIHSYNNNNYYNYADICLVCIG